MVRETVTAFLPAPRGLLTERRMMKRVLLKSKIHRANVVRADLDYEGSITIDRQLMDAADLVEHEQVDIYNITNGARLTTYVIPGSPGSGMIGINGAAAHLVHPGHLVIIVSYAVFSEDECLGFQPRIVHVDEHNRQVVPSPVG